MARNNDICKKGKDLEILLFFKNCFSFIYVLYLSAQSAYMLACQKRATDPIRVGCEMPCSCWKLNLGPQLSHLFSTLEIILKRNTASFLSHTDPRLTFHICMGVWASVWFCVYLCLEVYMCFYLFVYVCISVCVCVYICMYCVCISLCVCVPMCMSMCVYVYCVYLFVCVPVCICVSVFLCMSVYISVCVYFCV